MSSTLPRIPLIIDCSLISASLQHITLHFQDQETSSHASSPPNSLCFLPLRYQLKRLHPISLQLLRTLKPPNRSTTTPHSPPPRLRLRTPKLRQPHAVRWAHIRILFPKLLHARPLPQRKSAIQPFLRHKDSSSHPLSRDEKDGEEPLIRPPTRPAQGRKKLSRLRLELPQRLRSDVEPRTTQGDRWRKWVRGNVRADVRRGGRKAEPRLASPLFFLEILPS